MWGVVSTWPFSLQATQLAAEMLGKGGNAMDAAEAGIRLVESDPEVDSVGRGGFLNRDGILQLDAAVMDGNSLRTGAVAGLKGYEHPVSIARAVLERTKHAFLEGEGAAQFAREAGFSAAEEDRLVTSKAREYWQAQKEAGHDTIGLVALDESGRIIAATSTSGASMKLPGRVGDSPIIGSGFYAESEVGGCTATGLGEDIMKTCLSFRVVEMMRGGMTPQEAADTAIKTAHESLMRRNGRADCMAVVCMNARGEFGAACNHQGFRYSRAGENAEPAVFDVVPVIDRDA